MSALALSSSVRLEPIGNGGGVAVSASDPVELPTAPARVDCETVAEGLTALHWCDVPLCVHASLEPSTHLLLGTASENMADRAMKGRMPSATAARWRRLSRAERSARSRQLREELKTHGWDEDVVRELVHGIDPDHPTLF